MKKWEKAIDSGGKGIEKIDLKIFKRRKKRENCKRKRDPKKKRKKKPMLYVQEKGSPLNSSMFFFWCPPFDGLPPMCLGTSKSMEGPRGLPFSFMEKLKKPWS